MLSQQVCTNQAGKHRRQNSTPTLSTSNKPTLLPTTPRRHEIHGRGISFDNTPSHGLKREHTQVDIYSVEHDLRQQNGQAQLQETQQTVARPGQQQDLENNQHGSGLQNLQQVVDQGSDHNYLFTDDIKSLMTGLDPSADSQGDMPAKNSIDLFVSFDSAPSAESLDGFGKGLDRHNEQGEKAGIKNMQAMPNTLPHTYAQGNANVPHRPRTPVNQKNTNGLPMTPLVTPLDHRKHAQHSSFSRTAASSPSRRDPGLTINASHALQRGKSCQDNFAAMRQHAMSPLPTSPPKTAPLQRRSVDYAAMPQPNFLNLSDLKMEMPSSDGGYNPANYSPITNPISPTMSSFQSSPEVRYMSLFDSTEVDNAVVNAKLSYFQASQGATDVFGSSFLTRDGPEARDQFMSEIDVEECIEETGITMEEIASFIHGPYPEDSKWRCLYEDEPGKVCGKRFARKENAKSHVQTHLGDRPYVCKVCKTRFVRQHDLKRHFKIHTPNKPHKCPCGKEFHRHDALTRHRQRGMCSGAFEGTPKKTIKRGRPKKQRPNPEERLDKAAKTRQYVMERTRPGSTYASSISGSSEYSQGSPPSLDNMSVTASSPSLSHKAFQDFSFARQTFCTMTPPTSPGYSNSHAFSSPYSQHSYMPKAASQSPSPKITSIQEEPYGLSGGFLEPMKELEETDISPPGLDLSSSSPATSCFFDFVRSSNGTTSGTSLPDIKVDCLNPQFLDFPLFDGTSPKEGQGTATFDEFFNLGDARESGNSLPQQKQDENHPATESVLSQSSFTENVTDDPDDIFSGL